jgi:hypothetical protein
VFAYDLAKRRIRASSFVFKSAISASSFATIAETFDRVSSDAILNPWMPMKKAIANMAPAAGKNLQVFS